MAMSALLPKKSLDEIVGAPGANGPRGDYRRRSDNFSHPLNHAALATVAANAEVLRLRYKPILSEEEPEFAGCYSPLQPSRCSLWISLRGIWQNDTNCRSLAEYAFRFDPAAVQPGDVFDDG